jgi:PKD repeat protein
MNRIAFTLLMLCFQLPLLMATEVTVAGSVVFGFQDPLPVGGFDVSLTILGADPVNYMETTDEDGSFLFEVEVDTEEDGLFALIRTFDPCTGEEVSEELFIEDAEEQLFSVILTLCSDINPPPPPSGCEAFFGWEQTDSDPYIVEFYDLSYTGTDQEPDSWEWDFGDGNTSNEQNPSHEYAQEGDYEVVLTITYDTCAATIVHPVHVIDFDFCNCEWEYDPVCVVTPNGTIIPFINECEAICAGFEDAEQTDCEGQDPCGCPEIYFPVCALSEDGDTLTFDNPCFAECEGYGEDSYIDCPGDGPCGCTLEFEPVCVLNEEGILEFFPNPCYAECAGFEPSQFEDCFGFGCHAYFEFDVSEETGEVFFMDLSESTDSPIVSWLWDFGDGNTSEEAAPVHIYEEPGLYFATLAITTEDGCTSTFGQRVCIGEGCIGNCDCPDIFDPVCVITPAGEIITLPNACVALCLGYGDDTFVDCVEDCECPDVFDPVCVATGEGFIEYYFNPCEAECNGYTPEDFVDCEEECICPDYLDPVCVLSADGDTLQFDNPCFAECEGYGPDQYFSCDYIDPCGCYEIFAPVCVELEDGQVILFPNDCYAMCEGYTEEDFVECDGFESCYANFSYELAGDGEVFFYDQSYSFEGVITEWLWFFGDGSTSQEQNPVYTYTEDGIYEVTLRIATEEGCEASFTQHICIGNGTIIDGPECQAMFFFEQATDIPLTFQFVDMSFGEVDSWLWDFGDGNSSTEQNPVHTYQEEGTYLVTLTTVAGDCQSSMRLLLFTDESIWYSNECTALFLPIIIPDSNQVFFLNLSSSDAVTYEWDFGDGNTSTDASASHQYQEGGIFEATLTITTADGCSSTFSVILNLDTEGFTANPTFQLLNNTEEPMEKVELQLSVFPNPASDQLNVLLETESAALYQLQLIGMDGKRYQQDARRLGKGAHSWPLNIGNLPAGMYLVRVQSDTGIHTTKVVKQ